MDDPHALREPLDADLKFEAGTAPPSTRRSSSGLFHKRNPWHKVKKVLGKKRPVPGRVPSEDPHVKAPAALIIGAPASEPERESSPAKRLTRSSTILRRTSQPQEAAPLQQQEAADDACTPPAAAKLARRASADPPGFSPDFKQALLSVYDAPASAPPAEHEQVSPAEEALEEAYGGSKPDEEYDTSATLLLRQLSSREGVAYKEALAPAAASATSPKIACRGTGLGRLGLGLGLGLELPPAGPILCRSLLSD